MSAWYNAHLTLVQSSFIYILLAMSLQVALRSGVFSLAGIGFFALGGYTSAILSLHGQSAVVAVGVPIVGGAIAGYVLSLPLVRLRGLYLALVTMSFDLIINVVANNGGQLTGGSVGLFGLPPLVSTTSIIVIVLVAILFVSQLERKNFGRAYEALRLNEDLAASLGIEVTRQRNFAFALSAMLGATAGALNSLAVGTINPSTAGFPLVVLGLTMAVLGGINTWLGSAVGAIVITWLPNVLDSIGEWRQLIYGGIVIVVAVYAPEGLVGIVTAGYRWIRRRASGPQAAKPPDTALTTVPADLVEARTTGE